jgi:hypothetical protein
MAAIVMQLPCNCSCLCCRALSAGQQLMATGTDTTPSDAAECSESLAGLHHGPVLHSGWLLKARRRGPRRSWRRTWVSSAMCLGWSPCSARQFWRYIASAWWCKLNSLASD